MSKKAYALLFLLIFAGLIAVVYRFLGEMGWQFALGVLFGSCVYHLGYYCKTGQSY